MLLIILGGIFIVWGYQAGLNPRYILGGKRIIIGMFLTLIGILLSIFPPEVNQECIPYRNDAQQFNQYGR